MYFVWWLKIFTIKSLQLSLIRSIYLQNEAACLSQCKQGKADAFIATAMSCSRWNLLRIFIRYVALVIFKNVKKRKQIFMKVKEKLKSGRKFKKKQREKRFVRLWRTLSVWSSSFLLLLLLCSAAGMPPWRRQLNSTEQNESVSYYEPLLNVDRHAALISSFQMSDTRRLTVSVGFHALMDHLRKFSRNLLRMRERFRRSPWRHTCKM